MSQKIQSTTEAWETRILGASEEHAQAVTIDRAAEIDASLDLKSISIRLQTSLIEDLKTIAQANGIGYQPLMRQVLTRFAQAEMKQMARERAAELNKALQDALDTPESIDHPANKRRTA